MFQVACQYAKNSPSSDEELATQLYNLVSVYYNSTGKLASTCFQGDCPETSVAWETYGWPWQVKCWDNNTPCPRNS